MSLSLAISPDGELRTIKGDDSDELSTPAEAALRAAFAESTAAGLAQLASPEMPASIAPALNFWREFSRQFFQAICQLGEEGLAKWKSLPAPAEEQLGQLVAAAPPMLGLEYLNTAALVRLWNKVREHTVAQANAHRNGPAGYLASVNPLWHLLGRVTFHLAENKRDEARPFAFLATYTHRLSGQTSLKHLPLSEALKTYASSQDAVKLTALLEPVKRSAATSPLVRELLDSKAIFSPQAWTIRQAYRFLQETPRMEEAGVVVRVPNWWSARQPPRPQVQVQLGGRQASEIGADRLLEFHVGIALDGEPLTDEERQQLLLGTEGLALLRGKWVEVNSQRLQQALEHWQLLARENAQGVDFVRGMRLLAGAQLSETTSDEVNAWSRVTAGEGLHQQLDRLRRPETIDTLQPGRDLQATLRPYQVDGVRWLWFMTAMGLGACLADDMGLGKTIQVIDLLLQRKGASKASRGRSSSPAAPNLLIVPASLVGNWRQELARFAPQLRALFLHRSEIDADTLASLAQHPQSSLAEFDLIVTTYGFARRLNWLHDVSWSLVILDEAQAIKNATSQQARSVKKLPARGRIVLTGTPVENHLGDLWSLFDFCCPGLLGSAAEFKRFVKRLNAQKDAQAYGALRRLVRPYILRRLKTDPAIAPDLPNKTELRTECGLSKKQAALYEKVVAMLADQLAKSEGIQRRGIVLASLMQLKQICNHPAQYLRTDKFTPADSAKFERLELLCQPIVSRQEKLLLFTQFQSLAEPLAEYLSGVFGQRGLVLHGATPVKKRTELVHQFQHDANTPFFVISLKAGGSGLNLTAASHVVHFDRWWNPAVENQATDRAFRIGQQRNVMVHKFVCRGTVEERIDAMIQAKQAVADQVLGQAGETVLTEMKDDELLRFVALDINKAVADD